MKPEEWNLSDKIYVDDESKDSLTFEDVKEFIKRLKEEHNSLIRDINYALDHFDWRNSPLDAKSIQILNSFKNRLIRRTEELAGEKFK